MSDFQRPNEDKNQDPNKINPHLPPEQNENDNDTNIENDKNKNNSSIENE